MTTIKAIDIFCGVGGLTHGLQLSGVDVVEGYDIDPNCAVPFRENNNAEFVEKSVSDIKGDNLSTEFLNAKIKLLAGCAPCQPFSTYTQSRPKDARWGLLGEFTRLVSESSPDLVTMENVPDLQKHSIFQKFVSRLKTLGYSVFYKVVFCPDYGVPQNRKRLVLLASRLGDIELIPPTHKPENYLTVGDAIKNLPRLRDGKTSKKDVLHRSAKLSEINLRRVKASKPGGTWKDWPEELRAKCHKRDSGKKYISIYGRMEWNKPSPTITTQFYNYGSGRHGHPSQARAISVREAAVLQSFPSDYNFVSSERYSIVEVSKMIGNAVPVKLAEAIGKSFNQHLEEVYL